MYDECKTPEICDLINDFIAAMEKATGKTVDVDISPNGKVSIEFNDVKPLIETRPEHNWDVLYRELDKMNESYDLAMQNNVMPDDSGLEPFNV